MIGDTATQRIHFERKRSEIKAIPKTKILSFLTTLTLDSLDGIYVPYGERLIKTCI